MHNIKKIHIINNKYSEIMNVDAYYKADSFEKHNISFILKDMASL